MRDLARFLFLLPFVLSVYLFCYIYPVDPTLFVLFTCAYFAVYFFIDHWFKRRSRKKP
ncbi:hypothetical protein [Sporolactobacillus vineae]|uniref:hypothetical protein n=1 Tax=Sporolactobacillus vineae TaxID=444463 RepID=UPI0002DCC13A|nr:hypothetical protein [Sporolactobacillus vineae]